MNSILVLSLVIASILLWVWAIIDITKSEFEHPRNKIIWLLAILLFPTLGALFYFQFKRNIFKPRQPRVFNPKFKTKQQS